MSKIAKLPSLSALSMASVLALACTCAAQDGATAKPVQGGGSTAQLQAVQALLPDVTKFLKDPKGEAPVARVVQIQHKSLEAWQADKKKESRELVTSALDLEIAIDKKDWAEATKLADGITKRLPPGLKPDASGVQEAAAGKSGSLESKMKSINSAFKKIGTFLKTPTGEAPVALVLDMQRLALEAKDLDPKTADSKASGAEREKFLLGFKKEMREFVVELIDLHSALEKKDWDAASKVWDKLKKHQSDSHKVYKSNKGGGRNRGGDEGGDGGGEEAGKGEGPKKK